MINIGDVVGRKSYNCDIIFEVTEINDDQAMLTGKTIRLIADAPLSDLVIIEDDKLEREQEKEQQIIENIKNNATNSIRKKYLTGRILHIDGDENYMKKCLSVYRQLGLYAIGISMNETNMPEEVIKYVKYLYPDIVIITGHDSFNKRDQKNLDSYRNSKHFVTVIKKIRQYYPNYNKPIIIGGACQSHFEAIIGAGANFASSPKRVNIHSLDPAIIAVKCCTTPFYELVNNIDIINKTSNKSEGVGGVDTFGTMRTLYT